MAINKAFQGHGTFCYLPAETMRHYRDYGGPAAGGGSASGAAGFARALADMGMAHVWVRLFGLEGVMDPAPTKELVEGLRAANIHVAGWGYCHGRNNWRAELQHAIEESDRQGLTAFVADIEPGRELGGTHSKWREDDFNQFVDGLVAKFGRDNVGISTWPVLKIQNDPEFPSEKLMRNVAGKIGMFAPQAYWMSYPKDVHYGATGFNEADYPRNDPASFVRLVIDSWRKTGFEQPLVVTGQAYWGESGPALPVLESKVADFAARFTGWPNIIGMNWWHAGGEKAMSSAMLAALKGAQLGQKPFAQPVVPGLMA